MTYLVIYIARLFLCLLVATPVFVLNLMAYQCLCERFSKHTDSEMESYFGDTDMLATLFVFLVGLPCSFLTLVLLELIDGWIGWQ